MQLIVATDRRLLLVHELAVVDVPYRAGEPLRDRVSKLRGRIGALSLTLGARRPVELTQVAPANLLSIARALVARGVDDRRSPTLIARRRRGVGGGADARSGARSPAARPRGDAHARVRPRRCGCCSVWRARLLRQPVRRRPRCSRATPCRRCWPSRSCARCAATCRARGRRSPTSPRSTCSSSPAFFFYDAGDVIGADGRDQRAGDRRPVGRRRAPRLARRRDGRGGPRRTRQPARRAQRPRPRPDLGRPAGRRRLALVGASRRDGRRADDRCAWPSTQATGEAPARSTAAPTSPAAPPR